MTDLEDILSNELSYLVLNSSLLFQSAGKWRIIRKGQNIFEHEKYDCFDVALKAFLR